MLPKTIRYNLHYALAGKYYKKYIFDLFLEVNVTYD